MSWRELGFVPDNAYIARLISQHYPGLTAGRITEVTYTHNAVFRVDKGEHACIVRLRPYKQSVVTAWVSECLLLTHLRQKGLLVPGPVPARDGAYIVPFESQSVACVFELLPGQPLTPASLKDETAYVMGQMIARLHLAGNELASAGISFDNRSRLDGAGLYTEAGLYALGDLSGWFAELVGPDVLRAQDETLTLFDALTPEAWSLIHGDLVLKNWLKGAQLALLDFEFSGWGASIYDVATVLWQLKPEASYERWSEQLLAGYESLRGLPTRQHLEAFIVARQLASMRWLARNQHLSTVRPVAQAWITQRATEVQDYLETGVLRRKTPIL